MKNIKPIMSFAAVSAFFVFCLLNSERVVAVSLDYLVLCGKTVFPSLFVFSVLTRIICYDRFFYKICAMLPRIGTEGLLLILGILGGFPLGGSVAKGLYDSGKITKRQAEYLCSFTNNPSVGFTAGFVGACLGSVRRGAILALLVFVSSVICAAITRTTLPKSERNLTAPTASLGGKGLAAAISDSMQSMLAVCGCVVFFGCAGAFLPQPLGGFAELVGGVAQSSNATLTAVLLGFSGICVYFQVSAVTGGVLSLRLYLLSKLIQSAIMGIFSYIIFDIVKI